MRQDLTDITIILDRSGSMEPIRDDTIGGVNTFVDNQKGLAGAASMTLVKFDDVCEVLYRGKPIADAPALTRETYNPRGSTALLDAIGKTIERTGARFSAMQEQDRPAKVIIVIVTDGQENASREFTKDKVMEMIRVQRDVYKWDFVFLAANQDAIASASSVGIAAGKAMSYGHNSAGVREVFSHASAYASRSRAAGSVDASLANVFSQVERDEAEKHIGGSGASGA